MTTSSEKPKSSGVSGTFVAPLVDLFDNLRLLWIVALPVRSRLETKLQTRQSHSIMPLPEFTPDEAYLINCIKSSRGARFANPYMWSYLIGGAIIAGFAATYDSFPMLLSAFVVVIGFRVYEERFQAKWLPQWQAIIAKYEVAADANDGTSDESDQP